MTAAALEHAPHHGRAVRVEQVVVGVGPGEGDDEGDLQRGAPAGARAGRLA